MAMEYYPLINPKTNDSYCSRTLEEHARARLRMIKAVIKKIQYAEEKDLNLIFELYKP